MDKATGFPAARLNIIHEAEEKWRQIFEGHPVHPIASKLIGKTNEVMNPKNPGEAWKDLQNGDTFVLVIEKYPRSFQM